MTEVTVFSFLFLFVIFISGKSTTTAKGIDTWVCVVTDNFVTVAGELPSTMHSFNTFVHTHFFWHNSCTKCECLWWCNEHKKRVFTYTNWLDILLDVFEFDYYCIFPLIMLTNMKLVSLYKYLLANWIKRPNFH